MKIQWNKVTWYSKFTAIIVFVMVFATGFYLGKQYKGIEIANSITAKGGLIAKATYVCPAGQSIDAAYYKNRIVDLRLSDGRVLMLPQVISGSGARYSNGDESFVFWNKVDSAFITENDTVTYTDCAIPKAPK